VRPQLGEEAALPDPRLAEDRRDATLPGTHDRERVAEARELGIAADHRRAHVLAEATRAHGAAPESGDLVAVDRLGLALELEPTGIGRLDERRHEFVGRGGDEHPARRSRGLHPRRDVHRVAHGGVLVGDVAADHPDDDRPRVDAHAHPELDAVLGLRVGAEGVDLADHVQTAAHRALGVVLVRDRRPEEHEHAVAHEPRDGAVVPRGDRVEPAEGLADQDRPVLGVELLGDRGGAGDVGEQDGERAAFAGRHSQAHTADASPYCPR